MRSDLTRSGVDRNETAIVLRRLKSLAVVVPLFNEQDVVERLHASLTEELRRLGIPYTIVFVDDGSTDGTLRILDRIADCDAHTSVLSLSRNWGHQIALTAGLDHAEAAAVIVMDGDLQHPVAVIREMISKFESGAEIVYAVRRSARGAGRFKRWASDTFYAVFEHYAQVRVVRGSADFRLMSGNVVASLRGMRESHRYIRGMVPWLGFNFSIVEYDQAQRGGGTPSYTWRKSLRLAEDALFSFSTLPLKLLTWCGVILSVSALAYLAYVLAIAFLGYSVDGWASVIAVLLIVSAVQFISIGILAKYLGMVFEQTKARPLYVLKAKRVASSQRVETI